MGLFELLSYDGLKRTDGVHKREVGDNLTGYDDRAPSRSTTPGELDAPIGVISKVGLSGTGRVLECR